MAKKAEAPRVFAAGGEGPDARHIDRNLALELVRVTEAAALAASRLMGRGDEKAADQAAVDAMRHAFDTVAIDGTVVIGEGERDEAPMLYIGEKVGSGGMKADIALDPLEGTTITAKGGNNALSVVALAEAGNFLNAPDVYMDKIAVGGGLPDDLVDLDETPEANLKAVARAKKMEVSDLVVCILDRPRHAELIKAVRGAGARIMLISDGDVSGVIATSQPESGIDMYMGSGGAPEGVLAAAALRCIGGQIQGRLLFRNDEEKKRAAKWGITDLNRKYSTEEMAKGDVMFAATGVTNGAMLRGVRRFGAGATTHSLVMRSKSGTVRYIEAHHNFTRKSWMAA
ncbi:class II fructose-bisphosphatase [Elioraea tepidiphila]|jgi:fructose-1,6-bisphosphatase II / sedoheptulose-1,7-bisphosphatase|uniref:class II fructose-bisphosphatase n=1 Tax=Elioraea tepidiphila TaxID=457934 RepID=UPI000373C077